jgi:hypothetical protein
VQLGNVALKNGSVPIVGSEVGINSWNRLCQPFTVPKRNEPVLLSMPELHRHTYGVQLKTPRVQLRHAVVPPSFAAGTKSGAEATDEEISQLRRTRLLRELIRLQRQHCLPLKPEPGSCGGFVFQHELGVVDVRLPHSGEVVESWRSIWGRRCKDPNRDHAPRKEGPAGKCVRSPAGHAPHSKAIDPQGVRDCADIFRAIPD